jgi:hypothetical protein
MATAKKQTAAQRRSAKAADKKRQNSKAYRAARVELVEPKAQLPADAAAIMAEIQELERFKPNTTQIQLFEYLVSHGTPIQDMGCKYGLPSETVLWYAIADPQSPFAGAYARGKQRIVAKYEEEIDRIASTPCIGEIITDKHIATKFGVEPVTEVRRFDNVDHRKLLIDTKKWTLAHLRPKKHGKSPDGSGDKPNDQLTALFDALSKGPSDSNVD